MRCRFSKIEALVEKAAVAACAYRMEPCRDSSRKKARFGITDNGQRLLNLVHRQLSPKVLPIRRHCTSYDRRKRLLVLRILLRQGLNESHVLLESLYLVGDVGQGVLVNQVQTLLFVGHNKGLDDVVSLAVQG